MTYSSKIRFKGQIIILICLLISFFIFPLVSLAQSDGNYPKLANYYIAWDVGDNEIQELAKWDLVILSPQALERNPQVIAKLKEKNPQIKILVYVLLQEINYRSDMLAASPYYQKVYNAANQNNWWLKTSDGTNVSWWQDTYMINAAITAPKVNGQNWSDFLPELINQEFFQKEQWDGVFYDNAWPEIAWLKTAKNISNIDINGDGVADSDIYMNENWQKGVQEILTRTKEIAPSKIIVINTNSNLYNNLVNGRMREGFPGNNEGNWSNLMNNYTSAQFGYAPNYFIVNANTNNTGNKEDYKNVRFGLTSTLMDDGYFSFDFGDMGHNYTWWYDEYDVYLGQPVSEKKNVLNNNNQTAAPSVWQRDFQNGIILVNSSATEQKINFDQEYEKIKGAQDASTNNGAIIKNLKLTSQDGIILLRRIEDIKNSPYYNGSFVRVFDKFGDSTRNGFFLYSKRFKGGNVIAKQDINKDGQIENITADSSKIIIYDNNLKPLTTFYPYGQKYSKGINFAITDFENDGYLEIVTGTGRGYAPLVKVFNYKGEAQGDGFYAYAKTYLGGVNVAACSTKGNGNKEIVTGTGYMGGPQVRIFDKYGKVLSGGFFAYGKDFRGGVNVACGDIDGNGIDEIVTGAGYGGSSHVRYFNSKFEPLSPGFWAFGKDSRTGVRVFLSDLDNDGSKEILTASPDTFTTAFSNFK